MPRPCLINRRDMSIHETVWQVTSSLHLVRQVLELANGNDLFCQVSIVTVIFSSAFAMVLILSAVLTSVAMRLQCRFERADAGESRWRMQTRFGVMRVVRCYLSLVMSSTMGLYTA